MKYPKIPLAQTIVALCKDRQIKHIVISPGSRSAPLTIGFTNDPYFKCYSIVDERCAAFFALGIAQNQKHPVALVCTSGSALLNYFPAVSEAFYSDIPLVVLSADRPKHLIDIGDGQTINQKNVYGTHVLYSTNLKLDLNIASLSDEDELPILKSIENKFEKFLGIQESIAEFNAIEISTALDKAANENGPVHINAPFDEPLYETADKSTVNCEIPKSHKESVKTKPEDLDKLVQIWNSCQRKMVLVGVNQPNTIDQKWLDVLAEDDSVVVFTETTSNIHHTNFFPCIDQIIAPLHTDGFEALQPDLLITFGGMVVSKKIKAFLRTYKPKHHWHIDEKKAYDTYFALTQHLKGQPNTFFKQFLKHTNTLKSSYWSYWNSIKLRRLSKHKTYLSNMEFCDFKVFETVLKVIPDYANLQVGNSSAIRYTQLFQLNPTLKVFCNRGTSGIDGSTSTALGYATVSNNQTVFITGDLSFFYDSNALWNNYIPSSCRIILINNEGGGIFRILPGHKNTGNFDTYFETKHSLNASKLCEMYGFEYDSASSIEGLNDILLDFFELGEKPRLVEVFTPSLRNDEVLLNYFKAI